MKDTLLSLTLVAVAGVALFVFLRPQSNVGYMAPASPQGGMTDEQAKWQGLSNIFGSLAAAGAYGADSYFDNQGAMASEQAWADYSAAQNGT